MAKQINIEYQGNEYILEYTRKSIEILERQGFNISDLDRAPLTTLPMLFRGAFIAHHRGLFANPGLIDKIFEKMPNKETLLEKLSEMYREPFDMLLADPDESEGNAKWGASW
jgi:hypothetical protein